MNLSFERISTNSIWAETRFRDHFARYFFTRKYIKNKRVLDIACGFGYGTKIISSKASLVFGVDSDESVIKSCKTYQKGENIEYYVGDATKLDFDNKSFDCIVSFETIEHIIEYNDFLREVKRLLTPDGIFIVSTPNYSGELIKNNYHVSDFTENEFKDLMRLNFKKVDFYYQGKSFFPFPGRGFLEILLGIKRDVAIRRKKTEFKHAVSIAICRN